MDLNRYQDSPVETIISFHKMIVHLEKVATSNQGLSAQRAQQLLKLTAPYPVLREGTTDPSALASINDVITELLAELFPAILTNNEIKAVTVPFQNVLLNPSDRLQRILNAAGPKFDMVIRNFNDHQFYVNTCCLILNQHYGTNFNFGRPLLYDIPNAQGIMRHYRILYNTDFIELTPTDKAVDIQPEDIELLRDSFDDINVWKRYFPNGSWLFKGFAIMNLFDATVEHAVSTLKGSLLGATDSEKLKHEMLKVFRSIYKIPDLKFGFTSYNEAENKFSLATFNSKLNSYLLKDGKEQACAELSRIIQQDKYSVISDVGKLLQTEPENGMARLLTEQHIQSVILAPVIKNGVPLGVLELASPNTGDLNSINAPQLEAVMPYISDTIDKQHSYMQNQVQALIQNEYTTVHPSVYWKFRKEAQKALDARAVKKEYALREIIFPDVMPLYGQVDIKGSSTQRNTSVQLDLYAQLNAALSLVKLLQLETGKFDLADTINYLQELIANVKKCLKADSEQFVQHYLETVIHPLFESATGSNTSHQPAIDNYFKQCKGSGDYHLNRRKYEDTVALINRKMATLIDEAQAPAQAIFPHYYERFKTDGVEHNLYIGASIAPAKSYNIMHLYNLRLWQLQVICHMESAHQSMKKDLPYPLDVTSLILVYNHRMSIQFRMDEKRFDVVGSYNARFEILKKRIDKACIKDTTERLTAAGKIAIVYTSKKEETEYLRYIHFLQDRQLLGKHIELVDIEDLQGVSGLKAIRVSVTSINDIHTLPMYSYADMTAANLSMNELLR
ncbi:GAF domain-containing protein [Chitinophaga sp. S165]|uniref:GAF domain-containing protein n=1 Tax=Chitinophaga sp. S165 TaxID=2135462 RepID=UPI000D8C25A6|nr:GAF domain-containing protein [Chitinophaga sp. S165]PWV48774.1 hypothetical protein C7475_10615 [Chitinophaga sp. S165]